MTRIATMAAFALWCWLAAPAFADDGVVPSRSYSPDAVDRVISPPMGKEAHNQPSIVDGYLLLAGNASHAFWDIADPFAPELISTFLSPHHDGEAESHQIAFARHPDGRTLGVTISGRGVDLWDLSDAASPTLLAALEIEGINYGDNSRAVWGVAWQGEAIFVGGTNTGLHVVDARDLTAPVVAAHLPTTALGGVSAGPLFALGNLLVVTTPKNHAGIATVDISDPWAPALLDAVLPEEESYIGHFYGRHAYLLTPFRTYDVITDPRAIAEVGRAETLRSEYLTFGDDHLFLGMMRPNPGVEKHRLLPDGGLDLVGRVLGRRDDILSGLLTDDQFSLPVGNLLVLSDDEIRIGSALAVHAGPRDTTGPRVLLVDPADGATGLAGTTRIGLSFSDQIDLRSVTPTSLSVRPAGGGEPLAGWFGHQQTLITFWPTEPLRANTTYEIRLDAGGVTDLVGNGLEAAFSSTFTVGSGAPPPPCAIEPTTPTPTGARFELRARAAGPDATYAWSVGGESLPGVEAATVTHALGAVGRHPVTLTVTTPSAQRTCAAVQVVAEPPGDAPPQASSSVAAVDGGALVVTDDAHTLARLDLAAGEARWEVVTGADPRSVALDTADRAWVAARGDDAVVIHAAATGNEVARVELGYGAAPYGLARAAAEGVMVVALSGRGEVALLDETDGTERARVVLGGDGAPEQRPRVRGVAIAPDGHTAWISRHLSADGAGEVYVVDVTTAEHVATIPLAIDTTPDESDRGRGLPNHLGAAAFSPGGRRAWVPAKKDNLDRGLQRDGEPLIPTNTVRAIVAALDPAALVEVAGERKDLDDHEGPEAAVAGPHGAVVFVASRGTNQIDVLAADTGEELAGLATGLAPRALALDDQRRLFVHDTLTRSVSVFDVSALVAGASTSAPLLARIPAVTSEPLPAPVLLGKQIFHNADSPRMSQDGYISCASCHLDGAHDGRTWDFTDRGEGLRNTIDLRGRAGTAHGPVHWTANFDEIHDFEHDIRFAFGGAGLMTDAAFAEGTRGEPLGDAKAGASEALDALAAYVATLTGYPRSPFREHDGAYTPDAIRGAEVFAQADCGACHTGDILTDSPSGARHDVGTLTDASGQRLGAPLDGLDTPTLHGVWATAPYLHDGSAATLRAALTDRDHGGAASLSDADLDALVALLLQLDGAPLPDPTATAPDAPPTADAAPSDATGSTDLASRPLSSGGGCAGPPGAPALFVALTLALRRRRQRVRGRSRCDGC